MTDFKWQPITPLTELAEPQHWCEALYRPPGGSVSDLLKQALEDRTLVALELRLMKSAILQAPLTGIVSLNLSTRTLNNHRFIPEIAKSLTRCPLSFNRCCIEVTEHSPDVLNNVGKRNLDQLMVNGAQLAIDDLGKPSPADELFDLGFISIVKVAPCVYDWPQDAQDRLFEQIPLECARVFEEIETDEQLQWAISNKATHIQSWHTDQLRLKEAS